MWWRPLAVAPSYSFSRVRLSPSGSAPPPLGSVASSAPTLFSSPSPRLTLYESSKTGFQALARGRCQEELLYILNRAVLRAIPV